LKDRLILAEKIISSLLPVAISASKVEINEDLSKNNQGKILKLLKFYSLYYFFDFDFNLKENKILK